MSETILILDKMPRACGYCIERAYDCYDNIVCQVEQKTVQDACKDDTRPDWCPLHPMPEPIMQIMGQNTEYWQGYMYGWNKCLNAVEGNDCLEAADGG